MGSRMLSLYLISKATKPLRPSASETWVFASLGLHDAGDVLRAVDIANPEPDHLARAQTCAVAESEQYVNLEIPRPPGMDGQNGDSGSSP